MRNHCPFYGCTTSGLSDEAYQQHVRECEYRQRFSAHTRVLLRRHNDSDEYDRGLALRATTRIELLSGGRYPGQSEAGGPSRLLELLWLDDEALESGCDGEAHEEPRSWLARAVSALFRP